MKSMKKFLKAPSCGCKKKTRKTYKGKKHRGNSKNKKGGYNYTSPGKSPGKSSRSK